VATAGLDNFTGGGDASAAMAAGVPMGRLGHVDEIADTPALITRSPLRAPDVHVVARVGSHIIADTTRALTMREANYPPVHYIPLGDVDQTLLTASAAPSPRGSGSADPGSGGRWIRRPPRAPR
jgi:hypothetical protein